MLRPAKQPLRLPARAGRRQALGRKRRRKITQTRGAERRTARRRQAERTHPADPRKCLCHAPARRVRMPMPNHPLPPRKPPERPAPGAPTRCLPHGRDASSFLPPSVPTSPPVPPYAPGAAEHRHRSWSKASARASAWRCVPGDLELQRGGGPPCLARAECAAGGTRPPRRGDHGPQRHERLPVPESRRHRPHQRARLRQRNRHSRLCYPQRAPGERYRHLGTDRKPPFRQEQCNCRGRAKRR